ncbi:MAG: MerR family transcriptional regulator [Acidimicrobiales bacterium]
MTIGQLAARTGLSVRTLRFYADAGVLPVVGRTASGYRLFSPDAVASGRLVRTLRELGVGLDDIKRVLAAERSLGDLAADHVRALDAQIAVLRLRRAVLRAAAHTDDREELEQMTELAMLTADERRRIVEDYVDAVFGDGPGAVAEKMRTAAPELPDDPTAEQVAAWVELAQLLRDPAFVETSRQMAERARAEVPAADVARVDVGQAVGELAGAAHRGGVDPASPEALAIVERLEAIDPAPSEDRAVAAERIEAFTDRRVGRYWTLVGIVNGWSPSQPPTDIVDAWEWYARALRAHA